MMIRGMNGRVVSFSRQSNWVGNRATKQAIPNRTKDRQRFILDTRTKSIRAFHYRKLALGMEGASSFKAVVAPFRNNKSQKYMTFNSLQLELQTRFCMEFDHKRIINFTTCQSKAAKLRQQFKFV